MENSRKAIVSIGCSSQRTKKSIKDCLEGFSYDDVASGSSDSISLTLNNSDLRFIRDQMPKKGDKLTPIISLYNWT